VSATEGAVLAVEVGALAVERVAEEGWKEGQEAEAGGASAG